MLSSGRRRAPSGSELGCEWRAAIGQSGTVGRFSARAPTSNESPLATAYRLDDNPRSDARTGPGERPTKFHDTRSERRIMRRTSPSEHDARPADATKIPGRWLRRTIIAVSCLLALGNPDARADGKFALRDGDRVVFYGDSITDQRL